MGAHIPALVLAISGCLVRGVSLIMLGLGPPPQDLDVLRLSNLGGNATLLVWFIISLYYGFVFAAANHTSERGTMLFVLVASATILSADVFRLGDLCVALSEGFVQWSGVLISELVFLCFAIIIGAIFCLWSLIIVARLYRRSFHHFVLFGFILLAIAILATFNSGGFRLGDLASNVQLLSLATASPATQLFARLLIDAQYVRRDMLLSAVVNSGLVLAFVVIGISGIILYADTLIWLWILYSLAHFLLSLLFTAQIIFSVKLSKRLQESSYSPFLATIAGGLSGVEQ